MPGVDMMVAPSTKRKSQSRPLKLKATDVQNLIDVCRRSEELDANCLATFDRLKSETRSDALCIWIETMTENTQFAYKNWEMFAHFLEIQWATSGLKVVKAFNHFVLSLVTEHSNIAQLVLNTLIKLLCPKPSEVEAIDPKTAKLEDFSKESMIKFTNICNLVVAIVTKVPLLRDSVCPLMVVNMPSPRFPIAVHVAYIHNLLLLIQLMPNSRQTFLEILLKYLLSFEVVLSRKDLLPKDELEEDIFAMDIVDAKPEGQETPVTENPLSKTVDILMCVVLNYVHGTVHGCTEVSGFFSSSYSASSCRVGSRARNALGYSNHGCECKRENHNNQMAVELYLDLKKVFPRMLLPIYSPSNVQFIYFYILAIRPPLLSDFLDFLTNHFTCNEHLVLRRNALCYLGSLISRGSFVSFSFLSSTLDILTRWCNEYARTKIKSNSVDRNNLWKYAPFNYACQTIFYIFTFRYKELVSDKNIKFSQGLKLMDLVSSPLNPLDNCSAEVADKFAAVANHFQIAYCYTAMENNRRTTLPVDTSVDLASDAAKSTISDKMFYPFEPHLLQRTLACVRNHCTEFNGFEENINFRQESSLNAPNSFDDFFNFDQSFN